MHSPLDSTQEDTISQIIATTLLDHLTMGFGISNDSPLNLSALTRYGGMRDERRR